MNDNFSIRGEVKLVDDLGNKLIDDHNMVVKNGRNFIRQFVAYGRHLLKINSLQFGYSEDQTLVEETDYKIDNPIGDAQVIDYDKPVELTTAFEPYGVNTTSNMVALINNSSTESDITFKTVHFHYSNSNKLKITSFDTAFVLGRNLRDIMCNQDEKTSENGAPTWVVYRLNDTTDGDQTGNPPGSTYPRFSLDKPSPFKCKSGVNTYILQYDNKSEHNYYVNSLAAKDAFEEWDTGPYTYKFDDVDGNGRYYLNTGESNMPKEWSDAYYSYTSTQTLKTYASSSDKNMLMIQGGLLGPAAYIELLDATDQPVAKFYINPTIFDISEGNDSFASIVSNNRNVSISYMFYINGTKFCNEKGSQLINQLGLFLNDTDGNDARDMFGTASWTDNILGNADEGIRGMSDAAKARGQINQPTLFSKLNFEDVAIAPDRDYLLTYTLYF